MTDLFEETNFPLQDVVAECDDDDIECADSYEDGLDARRRLERLMDEKRLRDELEDDFM
jgi:hypothetical protein